MSFPLLSISALCEIASISREILFREIAAGRLLAVKVGRRTLLRPSDFLTWVEQNQDQCRRKRGGPLRPEVTRILCAGMGAEQGRLAWTVPEFAHLTSLSSETIRREIREGRLEGVQIRTHHYLIPAEAGRRWIKNLRPRKVGAVA